MNRDFAIRQDRLKRKPAHLGQAARLAERESLLSKQSDREFAAQLRFAQVGRCQDVIGDRDRHDAKVSLYALQRPLTSFGLSPHTTIPERPAMLDGYRLHTQSVMPFGVRRVGQIVDEAVGHPLPRRRHRCPPVQAVLRCRIEPPTEHAPHPISPSDSTITLRTTTTPAQDSADAFLARPSSLRTTANTSLPRSAASTPPSNCSARGRFRTGGKSAP